MSEFDIIRQIFSGTAIDRQDVIKGIGDDCALLSPASGKQLAISMDTLISGVHFPAATSAQDIGYKSLAVNLSDLAAMGAEPAWASLAISLPEVNHAWLEQFMQGFMQLASQYNVALIGGDTTCGALSISITVIGYVESGRALRRDQAAEADAIFVTGTIGDARAGLESLKSGHTVTPQIAYCIERLNRPVPRIEAGRIISQYSRCAIDLSDGLLSDLKHICEASGLGADIDLDKLPLSDELQHCLQGQINWSLILNAGDDYELCFTVAADKTDTIQQALQQAGIMCTQIGSMRHQPGIRCYHEAKLITDLKPAGYDHFEK